MKRLTPGFYSSLLSVFVVGTLLSAQAQLDADSQAPPSIAAPVPANPQDRAAALVQGKPDGELPGRPRTQRISVRRGRHLGGSLEHK